MVPPEIPEMDDSESMLSHSDVVCISETEHDAKEEDVAIYCPTDEYMPQIHEVVESEELLPSHRFNIKQTT